jgi:hypothetical protein
MLPIDPYVRRLGDPIREGGRVTEGDRLYTRTGLVSRLRRFSNGTQHTSRDLTNQVGGHIALPFCLMREARTIIRSVIWLYANSWEDDLLFQGPALTILLFSLHT